MKIDVSDMGSQSRKASLQGSDLRGLALQARFARVSHRDGEDV